MLARHIRLALSATLAGFVATALIPPTQGIVAICGAADPASFELALSTGGAAFVGELTLSWALMLMGMMPFLLVAPVRHVWQSTTVDRRPLAAALFFVAYGWTWLALMLVVLPLAWFVNSVAGSTALPTALLLATAWSASPVAQAGRNACHRRDRIGAFGPAANWECLKFGMRFGTDCALICWPWMIVPLTTTGWLHLAAMAAVSLLIVLDRIDSPAPARWSLPPFLSVAGALLRRQKVFGSE